jgi:hypothetical protein
VLQTEEHRITITAVKTGFLVQKNKEKIADTHTAQ